MKLHELLVVSKFSVWICQNSFTGQLRDKIAYALEMQAKKHLVL